MGISFEDIFGNFLKQSDLVTLNQTSLVEDFKDEDLRKQLKVGYEGTTIERRFLATLVNSIFTQKSRVFIMSCRGISNLMKNDPNGNGKGIDSQDYRSNKRRLHAGNYIETLRNPKGRKAGVYKLIHPPLVELLNKLCSEEFFEAQEKSVLDFYDSGESDSSKSNTPRWEDL